MKDKSLESPITRSYWNNQTVLIELHDVCLDCVYQLKRVVSLNGTIVTVGSLLQGIQFQNYISPLVLKFVFYFPLSLYFRSAPVETISIPEKVSSYTCITEAHVHVYTYM